MWASIKLFTCALVDAETFEFASDFVANFSNKKKVQNYLLEDFKTRFFIQIHNGSWIAMAGCSDKNGMQTIREICCPQSTFLLFYERNGCLACSAEVDTKESIGDVQKEVLTDDIKTIVGRNVSKYTEFILQRQKVFKRCC